MSIYSRLLAGKLGFRTACAEGLIRRQSDLRTLRQENEFFTFVLRCIVSQRSWAQPRLPHTVACTWETLTVLPKTSIGWILWLEASKEPILSIFRLHSGFALHDSRQLASHISKASRLQTFQVSKLLLRFEVIHALSAAPP